MVIGELEPDATEQVADRIELVRRHGLAGRIRHVSRSPS
jgi:hypothetical protein